MGQLINISFEKQQLNYSINESERFCSRFSNPQLSAILIVLLTLSTCNYIDKTR
nr:MAG TPA: hypothetical protein [Caudoviricetes sp.]